METRSLHQCTNYWRLKKQAAILYSHTIQSHHLGWWFWENTRTLKTLLSLVTCAKLDFLVRQSQNRNNAMGVENTHHKSLSTYYWLCLENMLRLLIDGVKLCYVTCLAHMMLLLCLICDRISLTQPSVYKKYQSCSLVQSKGLGTSSLLGWQVKRLFYYLKLLFALKILSFNSKLWWELHESWRHSTLYAEKLWNLGLRHLETKVPTLNNKPVDHFERS